MPGHPGSTCIAVIDDEMDVLELVRAVLEDEGYRVVSFAHPLPVTRLLERHERPDLFLIDIMLPDMSGIELAKRLTDTGFEATPKVAMSASRERVSEARRSHLFDGTINKPFDIDDLLACVEAYARA